MDTLITVTDEGIGGGSEAHGFKLDTLREKAVLTALHMVNNSARCDRCVGRKAVCKLRA